MSVHPSEGESFRDLRVVICLILRSGQIMGIGPFLLLQKSKLEESMRGAPERLLEDVD